MTKPKKPQDKQRDAERTRAQIVEGARVVFSREGFVGARLEHVAREVGVSKALIYHYFSDKAALYAEALEVEVLSLRRSQRDLELRDLEPREAIGTLVDETFDYFYENPGLITFLNIENRLAGEHMRRSEASKQSYDPLLQNIAVILERGVEQGAFRPGLDPLSVYLSIAGLCYHFVANRFTLGAVFQRDLSTEAAARLRREEIRDFVLHGISA